MRLLIGAIVLVLVVLSVPLIVGSAARLDRIWKEWRHDAAVTSDWTPAIATIRGVRANDGLDLDLAYWDRRGDRRRAGVHVDTSATEWVRSTLPIRYDPRHPSEVDIVGVKKNHPLGQALTTGLAVGAGIAAALLAFAVWRRRAVFAFSDRAVHALRAPLALSGAVLTIGIAAWGVGTVSTQGWTSIADSIGVQASDLFGDFMVFIVPAVAFGAGALASAVAAQHRHHEVHEGMLGNAHRIIKRASEYMPSPDQILASLTRNTKRAAATPGNRPTPTPAAPRTPPDPPPRCPGRWAGLDRPSCPRASPPGGRSARATSHPPPRTRLSGSALPQTHFSNGSPPVRVLRLRRLGPPSPPRPSSKRR